MTELAFHFGAPNKLAYACRLVRKALGTGAQLVVVADESLIPQLDSDLWSFSATDFLPHCVATAAESVQSRSPVLLVTEAGQAKQRTGVLVNLTEQVPQGFERFARLIEVVSTDAQDRAVARARWRHYTEQGYAIARHDLSLKPAH